MAVSTHALRRFWWVLVIGAVLALLAALSARYTISLFPPRLAEKGDVGYTAESRLLITSADNPHFRAKETIPEENTDSEGSTPAAPLSTAPDLNTIVRNANTYPYVIESDQVANYREQQYGDLPGTVQALGVTSVVTGNRIEPSEIPIIRLIATADTPEDAINLADKTGKAFIGWLRTFQDDHDILESDRIDVQQLNVPKDAVSSEGSPTALPVVVFIAVLAAFCVLAVLLDRLIPASQPKPTRTEVEPLEPVEVKKTA